MEAMEAMEGGVDAFIELLGVGRWQIVEVIQAAMFYFGFGAMSISGALLNANVPFTCLSGPPSTSFVKQLHPYRYEGAVTSAFTNWSLEVGSCLQDAPHSLPLNPSLPAGCQHIIYDTSVFQSTFNTEYHLICEWFSTRVLFQTLFFIGAMVGSVMSGFISDKFGRRPVVRIGSLVAIALWLSNFYSPSLWFVLTHRFLCGVVLYCTFLAGHCLAIEMTPRMYRPMASMLPGVAYGISVLCLAGGGYWGESLGLRNWRSLNIMSTAPVLLMLPVIIIMKESPRWLVQQGRIKEAVAQLTQGVTLHSVPIHPDKLSILISEIKAPSTSNVGNEDSLSSTLFQGIVSLCRSPLMRRIIFITTLTRIALGSVYYGIVFNASNFTKDNTHYYLMLTGSIDMGIIAVAGPIASVFRRRPTMSCCYLVSGMLLVADVLIPTDASIARWLCTMSAYGIITISYHVAYLYSPELFPTEVRCLGVSLTSLSNSIGSLLAPIITELVGSQCSWGVAAILGSAALAASGLIWFLPETKGEPLFTTIQEYEQNLNRKSKLQENKSKLHHEDSVV